ncbi:tyrosine-type recombinase/integrase [Micromonospora sp. MS34]|uniref:tyrosine-type recombinase/integrase n=1 Tax=Micromonospora sp. MS34 TaxID=3385971 RepID=UPI00399F4533
MPADPSCIVNARQMLAHLGLTPADLDAPPDPSRRMPTLAEYLPRVEAAASPGTRRTYGTYWNRMAAALGHLRLNEVTASDIEALMRQVTAGARTRRTGRQGRHAGEHVIAAARAVYRPAVADGYLPATDSPAHRVAKPRRLPNPRRDLTPGELLDINLVARTSGNGVILDALLLRLHTETACRRGGAIALRLVDLDTRHCLIRLTEKGGTLRWQPITPTLAARLLAHAEARGAVLPTDRLLRYRNGQPISSRRYDHLWTRIGECLPWVAVQGISTHWLRHTTLTWVERHYGYG